MVGDSPIRSPTSVAVIAPPQQAAPRCSAMRTGWVEGPQRPRVGELADVVQGLADVLQGLADVLQGFADVIQRAGRAFRAGVAVAGVVERHISIISSREKSVKRFLSRASVPPVRPRWVFLAGWGDDLDRTDAQPGRRADDR